MANVLCVWIWLDILAPIHFILVSYMKQCNKNVNLNPRDFRNNKREIKNLIKIVCIISHRINTKSCNKSWQNRQYKMKKVINIFGLLWSWWSISMCKWIIKKNPKILITFFIYFADFVNFDCMFCNEPFRTRHSDYAKKVRCGLWMSEKCIGSNQPFFQIENDGFYFKINSPNIFWLPKSKRCNCVILAMYGEIMRFHWRSVGCESSTTSLQFRSILNFTLDFTILFSRFTLTLLIVPFRFKLNQIVDHHNTNFFWFDSILQLKQLR